MSKHTGSKSIKKSNTSAKGSGTSTVFKEDNKGPYAVVIANLLSSRFEPLVHHTAHCLLPLAGVPLLHFTLTRLIEDGFKDILIYACDHYEHLRSFLRNNSCYKSVRISVHNGETSHSLGDVMRDLDTSQVIRGVTAFLLVPADLICATPLMPILRQHEDLRSRNPNAILSLILPPCSPKLSPSQAAEWGVTVLFSHSADNRLIQLSSALDDPCPAIAAQDLLRTDQCSELASDLLDLGIAVCSHHIPALFQDNFDYQTMNDLVHDVLTNEEVMGYSIHINPLPSGPLTLRAAPDLHSLINITFTLLAREEGTASLFPPSFLMDLSALHCAGPSCYVAKSAKVHPKARLVGACLVGPGCVIGSGACLVDCALTSNCYVGRLARLRRVVALSDVIIGDRVRADTAWIGSGARILDSFHLPPSCFVGSSAEAVVTLGPGRGSLPPKCVIVAPSDTDLVLEPQIGGENVWATLYTRKNRPGRIRSGRTTSGSQSTGSESDWEEPSDQQNLDTSGEGSLWDTADDRIRSSMKMSRRAVNHSRLLSSTSESHRAGKASRKQNRRSSGVTDSEAEPSGGSADEGEQSELFLVSEIQRTLEHCGDTADATENVILEVNSLKHAYNIPIDDLLFLLVKAILDLTCSAVSDGTSDADEKTQIRAFMTEFGKQISRFHGVLRSYFSGSNADGRLCLQAVEDSACYQPLIMSSSPFIAHMLYDRELLTEPAIWWWLGNSPLLADGELSEHTKQIREKLKPFLTWLKDAEEEEDDDDETDESNED
ncbi:Translation initiation factor eIF-2B subunit epsilon [Clonorchis sinensis]|uniref:Translation initiation factor eIF2B subunit epsilon n=2 Tax=Clonorchis sinensis TaxID=79923 RepID=H2KRK2_CLOSI|nr:Translation initiation factor eIF-2B subunit epsilon [Clonorchis sinensis]GAA29488.2 translation initiation factor eIF-2B subunit epsilon [Clonorchis sinensis]